MSRSEILTDVVYACIPIASILAAIVAVLIFDLHLYRTSRPTISDRVRNLYARYGVVVPIAMISSFCVLIGIVFGALVIHFFLYQF